MKAMHYNFEETLVAILGAFVGLASYIFLGIPWGDIWQNIAALLKVGGIAAFSGAMSVIGKRMIEKYYKRKNKTP